MTESIRDGLQVVCIECRKNVDKFAVRQYRYPDERVDVLACCHGCFDIIKTSFEDMEMKGGVLASFVNGSAVGRVEVSSGAVRIPDEVFDFVSLIQDQSHRAATRAAVMIYAEETDAAVRHIQSILAAARRYAGEIDVNPAP